jgi:phosphohistidine phosphatase
MADLHRLALLRHAKSSWDNAACADHDRPLAPRGRRAGELLRDHLRTQDDRPTLVLCSSARRTRETFEAVAPALGDDVELHVEPDLYGASGGELLERIRTLPEEAMSVMVIGHNPGMEDLATMLAGRGVGGSLDRMAMKFPTGALARLTVPVRWRELAAGDATLVAYVVPRELE